MKSTKAFALLIVLIITFVGCKKNSSNKSKTELLTQKAWIQSNSEIKSGTSDWSIDPNWTYTPSCEKDDNVVLKADGTFEKNEGATKCNPSDSQVYITGVWSLLNDGNTLVETGREVGTTGSAITDTYTIDKLDENTMILSFSETDRGITTMYRGTLRH